MKKSDLAPKDRPDVRILAKTNSISAIFINTRPNAPVQNHWHIYSTLSLALSFDKK